MAATESHIFPRAVRVEGSLYGFELNNRRCLILIYKQTKRSSNKT